VHDAVRTEHGRLSIAHLVEDELLLGFPTYPRKPGLERVEYTSGRNEPENINPQDGVGKNPFSALQGLLKRDHEN